MHKSNVYNFLRYYSISLFVNASSRYSERFLNIGIALVIMYGKSSVRYVKYV